MKETNFKIIELPTHQVLLTKDFDNEDEDSKPVLSITFFLEGVKVCQTLGFKEDSERDEAFDNFSEEKAQELLSLTSEMIKDE